VRAARVLAQAKINLWLSVGPRDASGYHDVATLFHRIDLADEITVRVGGSVRALDVSGPALPEEGLGPAESNLAYRAAIAYSEHASWLRGFAIQLVKHIPSGGGLGGGSADAGAVLRALDALAPLPLGNAMLVHISAALGSDVPFLASESAAAFGTGRGERLEPLQPLVPKTVLIVAPGFAIATASAYGWLDEFRGDAATPATLPSVARRVDWDMVARHSHNDFEPVIENRYADLRVIRERLAASGAYLARLAGSGSSVFGVFDDEIPAAAMTGIPALKLVTRSSTRVVPVEVAE
jgi:4-diphosphocytidyl-2-C-methyl-D-erythritol kinase